MEAEVRLLASAGHRVELALESNERVAEVGRVRSAWRAGWSTEWYRAVRDRLRAERYDAVHVHNFFPLVSPSVYHAARAEGVPVVQTLHNYRLVCPGARLFRDGRVYEGCLGKAVPWSCLADGGCYRDSRAATAAVAAMLGAHRLARTWSEAVDLYVVPSRFAAAKLVEGGLPAERVAVKPHFVDPDPAPGDGRGGYALFVGRLSPEKGVGTLLRAWEKLAGLPLLIVGDGPLAGQVGETAGRLEGVRWLGARPLSEVYELLGNASFLVFPSEWHEVFGRVIIEAYAKGTPVLAARAGAAGDLVDEHRTGLLFEPGDADELAKMAELLWDEPSLLARMRSGARAEFLARYTAGSNLARLEAIYESVGRGA